MLIYEYALLYISTRFVRGEMRLRLPNYPRAPPSVRPGFVFIPRADRLMHTYRPREEELRTVNKPRVLVFATPTHKTFYLFCSAHFILCPWRMVTHRFDATRNGFLFLCLFFCCQCDKRAFFVIQFSMSIYELCH